MPDDNNNLAYTPVPSALGMLGYFDQQITANPAATALRVGDRLFSYGEIAIEAAAFAGALASEGVGAGDKVAVGIGRSPALLPLLLAIWSLRASYIPVDPSYPSARQSYILANAGARLLLCDAPPTDLEFSGRAISLDALSVERSDSPPVLANADSQPQDLAYIIYTSGSTGDPKGVAVTQGNVLNFLLGMLMMPGLSQADRLLAVTTISFDIHVLELFLPLMAGAEIVLASREDAVSAASMQALIDSRDITVMQATPATWRMLLGHSWRPARPLKILVGGEALPRDLQPQMFAAASELWNMYGPTETTVWSLCHRIESADEKIYIGRPIRNTSVFVIDEEMQPLPPGSAGELLIGGDGVAVGYYGQPELTSLRFIDIPGVTGGRVYRTGDLVICHPNGVLEYLDRIDNQIKVRGFRIEPLEVERTLETYPEIKQACVVAATFAGNDKRLTAYYLGSPVPASQLQQYCVTRLPPHMVPQHYLFLDQFPMTANNKIDRKQLAAMGADEVKKQRLQADQVARDDLDRSLIAVWENALGVRGIGLNDNFFSLGGHSLLALQVVHDMNRATGMNFATTVLFEHPTLLALRDSIGEEADKAASVVRLNSQLEGDPVFCLCGVEIYQAFADQFRDRRPVYGVFAKEEIGFIEAQQQDDQLEYCFDSLVDSYAEAIKRQGSYQRLTLVGLSFGGLIALEVAKRFQQCGIEVSSVVLLDSYLSSSTYRSPAKTLLDMGRQVRRHGFRGLLRDLSVRSQRRHCAQSIDSYQPASAADAQDLREKAFDQAALVYEKKRNEYDFDVLLIKAKRMDFGFGHRARRDYGLSPFIKGKLTIRAIDADHLGLVKGDAVTAVYGIIAAYDALPR